MNTTTDPYTPKPETPSYTPAPETLFAYTILVERARQRRKITYRELYDLMQKEFGWPPFRSGHSWFQRLPLAEVGTLCGVRGEPCLSSLVRRQDKTIGKGYQTAHLNCYHVEITSHDYACECYRCSELIRITARDEMWKCYDYWSGAAPRRDLPR